MSTWQKVLIARIIYNIMIKQLSNMSEVIINTRFEIALKLYIDFYNQIRYIRKIPILPNALVKMAHFAILF